MAAPTGSEPAAAPEPSSTAVSLAYPPAVAAARVRRLVPPEVKGRPSRRVQRWGLIALLLAAGAAAVAIDARAGFPVGAFAWLVPFTWLGVVVVLSATHRHPPRRADWLRGFGCTTVLFGLLAVGALLVLWAVVTPYVRASPGSRSAGGFIFGSLLVLAAGGILARATHTGTDTPADRRARLRGAAGLIEALVDDAAPGKPLSGFIDVGGYEQASKLVRSGTTATGWKVSLYRDEWLRLRLVLRDGNRLRLSLVDRVKARAGRWKKGRSGKQKWKQGRSDWLATLELQLVVNPALYRVKPAGTGDAVQVGQRAGGGPVLTLAQPLPAGGFDPAAALRGVATLYGRIERQGSAT